jgi:uncharacterized membrane protein YjdF
MDNASPLAPYYRLAGFFVGILPFAVANYIIPKAELKKAVLKKAFAGEL